jgi:hypothetical protein
MIGLEGGRSLRLRRGTSADIPELLELTLSALEAGPDELYSYNFPFRHHFMEDHKYYWGLRLRALLYVKDSIFLVAENDKTGMDGALTTRIPASEWQIVAWAMWKLNSATERAESTPLGAFGDTWAKWLGRESPSASQRLLGLLTVHAC